MNPLNQPYQSFVDEVPQLLQEIEKGLHNIRQNNSTEVENLISAINALQTGAQEVGLESISSIAQKLKYYLQSLHHQDLVVDQDLVELFMDGYDCLTQSLVLQIENGSFDENQGEEVWQKLEEKLVDYLNKSGENNFSGGDDVVVSIFLGEISQEILRLRGLVASPDIFQPSEELSACFQVLLDCAESLNLSGFTSLVTTAQKAFRLHPDQAMVIANLLIQDLEKSRNLVLEGGHTLGGEPCSEMVTLAEDINAYINLESPVKETNQVDVNDSSYQFFIAEVPDILEKIESNLLVLKNDKSVNKINDIMRGLHTLKGGSASVGLNSIKNISHQMEDYVKLLFDETVAVDTELEGYLLDGFDCLRGALMEQIEQGSHGEQWEAQSQPIWANLDKKLGDIAPNDYLPSSADLGVDMMASMFESDVGEALEHLQQIVDSLPEESLTEEVLLQTEVFLGFAEMFKLSGFRDIAETASRAIALNPSKIQEITHLLIQDVTLARQEVLQGDRTQGGNPSPELKRLSGQEDSNLTDEPETFDFANLTQEIANQEEEALDFANFTEELSPQEEENMEEETLDFGQLIENLDSLEEETPSFAMDITPEEDDGNLEDAFAQYAEEEESEQKQLQEQSYQFFIEEAPELIALIDTGLEKVIQDPHNINEINEIARAAHSLKGGGRSAGLEDIGNIALRVEKSFKALFNENIVLDEDLTAYLEEIYQLLRQPLIARIENQEFDEKVNLDLANELWAEFEEKYGEELAKAEDFLPSSSDLGIDIATSIFEVDVAEGIKAVEEALAGDEETLRETLTMQTEVFTGFGEMLNLPGFTEICQITGETLQQQPQQLRAIASAFLDNIKQAHQLVMEGDRETGGSPSEELLTLAGIGQTDSTPIEEYQETPIDTKDPSYNFFIEEAPELLAMMEEGLLTLKQERSTGKIHQIMRAAHSIKGGAASVGLEAIKTIAHRLEDIIKVFYDETIIIDTELESLLLEGYDCLQEALTEQMQTGTYQPAVALAKAQGVWEALENRLGDALNRPDDFIPSSEDLGVDIVQSMFEVDVAQELQRLRAVLSTPTSQPLAGELRATLEVFAGFGEMLNLSGFASIAHLGLTALENNPNQVIAIIETVIQDADNARNLVLGGDRTTGGSPSQKLRELAATSSTTAPESDFIPESSEDIFYLDEENESSDIEEVLSDVVTNTDELINFALEDKETQTNSPSLEEVFGNQEDEFAMIESLDNQEEEESEIPSLEEIFTNEISEEEINLLSKASQLALDDDKNATLPSLEEVFTSPDFSNIEVSPDAQEEEEEDKSPSLDEVFGEKITFSTIEEAQEDSEDDPDSIPSLEDLIGKVPNVIEDSKQTITPENFIPTGQENNESSTESTEDIEKKIQSLQDVFDKLPGLRDEADINLVFRRQKSSPKKKTPIAPTPKPATPTPKSNLTVRVDLERLERMNNLIGELSINRNGLSLQNDKLQTSVKELLERFNRFQSTANTLRELSDKMLTSPEKFNISQGDSSFPLSLSEDGDLDVTAAFDSLEMDRYDNLYYVVQGLIEQMIQLEESVDDIALYAAQSGQTMENQRQMLNRMRDELMWARMLPLGEVLNRFPRVLRDLSVKYNKKVNLKLSGTNVLVDKAALEKLYDPLVHLMRNGFDHGIESPALRRQKGKSETGIIEVKAYHQGNQTIIEVKDDGGGLNLDKIGKKAVERGILTPEQLAVASKETLLDLIFQPGFSTAASVTEISGRGVGLDIVRSQLRALKGTISVDSNPNQGTTFTLKLPLTLTIDKLLVLSAESQFYALPSDNIEEIVVPESSQIKTSGNKRFLHFENRIIPIYSLDNLLHYRCHMPDISNTTTQALEVLPTPKDWGKPLLLIRQGAELFAIEVDHLVSEQELVIKPFGSALSAPSYTYGCTILGDGTLIPVINSAILLENYFQATQPGSSLNMPISGNGEIPRKPSSGVFKITSVLVVDDSAAMRRTLALSLEKAGYRVLQAKDGKEALDQLQQTSNISLVICDIEMPNMNGFEFLGQRRRFPELSKIPVAMLTSRSNEKHQKLATHLGADAYFTKPYIEQKFLQAIKNLVGDNATANV